MACNGVEIILEQIHQQPSGPKTQTIQQSAEQNV